MDLLLDDLHDNIESQVGMVNSTYTATIERFCGNLIANGELYGVAEYLKELSETMSFDAQCLKKLSDAFRLGELDGQIAHECAKTSDGTMKWGSGIEIIASAWSDLYDKQIK